MDNCQWPSERSNVKRAKGIYKVDQATSLMAQMSILTNQMQGLTSGGSMKNQEGVMMTRELNQLKR